MSQHSNASCATKPNPQDSTATPTAPRRTSERGIISGPRRRMVGVANPRETSRNPSPPNPRNAPPTRHRRLPSLHQVRGGVALPNHPRSRRDRTEPVNADENLHHARRVLDDAVHDLCSVQTLTVNGDRHIAPCLYVQLCEAIHDPPNRPDGPGGRASENLWLAAADLRQEIDSTVAGWVGRRGHTMSLLQDIVTSLSRPQDAPSALYYAAQVAVWADKISELLDGGSRAEVKEPCPECGARYVWQHRDGENVRVPALSIHSRRGCTCLGCGKHWPPSHFEFLARVLGCAPLEGTA